MFKNFFEKLRKLDWMLVVSALVLLSLGLAAIYSVSLSQEDPDFSNFKKQITFAVIGFVIFFIVSFTNYSIYRVYGKLMYLSTAILLILVLFTGSIVRGTKGWFSLFGLNFQPVELAKIVLIIMLARFFSNRLARFKISKHIIVSLAITVSFVFLVMLQPDLGSSLVLFGTWFLLIIMTGIPKKYLIVMLVLFVLVSVVAWQFFLVDYQQQRILVFLDPSLDPLGSGYNVTQSMIAIGSGQFFGRGLGFGSQSQLKFIPESQTDFVFAVIAEELGFLGVLLVLGFWSLIFYRLILIAKKAPDDFGMFLVLGVICVLFIHIFVNIGMNMGIMPVTGISLPFLSYGGSFLIITLVLIGIAESVAVRR